MAKLRNLYRGNGGKWGTGPQCAPTHVRQSQSHSKTTPHKFGGTDLRVVTGLSLQISASFGHPDGSSSDNRKPGYIRVRSRGVRWSLISTNTPHFANPGTNVSNLQLNPDGSIRNLGGYTEITSLANTGRDGIDERVFRFGLRVSF